MHRHGAEGAEATAGAEYSHKSSHSAVAVHRRWPPPPGSPTRLWPACGSCPWPWRTAQASARPLPGVGCRKGCRARREACRARAGHVQSVRQSARRALQSAAERVQAVVCLGEAHEPAGLLEDGLLDRLALLEAVCRLVGDHHDLAAVGVQPPQHRLRVCGRRGSSRWAEAKAGSAPPASIPELREQALHPGRRVGEAASPRGLCEQL